MYGYGAGAIGKMLRVLALVSGVQKVLPKDYAGNMIVTVPNPSGGYRSVRLKDIGKFEKKPKKQRQITYKTPGIRFDPGLIALRECQLLRRQKERKVRWTFDSWALQLSNSSSSTELQNGTIQGGFPLIKTAQGTDYNKRIGEKISLLRLKVNIKVNAYFDDGLVIWTKFDGTIRIVVVHIKEWIEPNTPEQANPLNGWINARDLVFRSPQVLHSTFQKRQTSRGKYEVLKDIIWCPLEDVHSKVWKMTFNLKRNFIFDDNIDSELPQDGNVYLFLVAENKLQGQSTTDQGYHAGFDVRTEHTFTDS